MEYKISLNGYYYKNNTRISEKEYKERRPVVGDKVEIIIKPYDKKITKVGIIKDVLTKKQFHSRGHKVRLLDGTIGRIVKIFDKKNNK